MYFASFSKRHATNLSWEQRKLGDLINETRDKTTVEDEDTLLSCAIDGMFLNSELFSHFRGSSNIGYLKVKKNDLILSAQNLHLGNCNVNLRFEHGIISPAYKVYELIECDPLFIQAWVKQDKTKDFFLKASTEGASVCRKNIVWEELYKQELPVPKIDEQIKIGAFFENIDNLITLHQCKHNYTPIAFALQKTNNSTPSWEQRKLGELCERVTRKNKTGESDLPLTIASQYGLIDQRDFFNKVVAAKDMSNYYLLKKGEFAYNKSYSNGYDFGSIKRLNAYEQGCLSTLYICFGITSDDIESDYLECFFDTLKWYSDITMICAEGARNHGLLNVDTKAFFDEVTIEMPSSKEEQRKISSYLNNLDNLITLHQR